MAALLKNSKMKVMAFREGRMPPSPLSARFIITLQSLTQTGTVISVLKDDCHTTVFLASAIQH